MKMLAHRACAIILVWIGLTSSRVLLTEDASSEEEINALSDVLEFMASQKSDFPWFGLPRYIKMANIAQLLNASKEYTFFLPLDRAFDNLIPQDGGDPFFFDARLRMMLLENLIVEGQHDLRDLPDGANLTTLSGNVLTVSNQKGKLRINEDINAFGVPAFRSSSKTKIYLVDRVPVITSAHVRKSLQDYHGNWFQRRRSGVFRGARNPQTKAKASSSRKPVSQEGEEIAAVVEAEIEWESKKCSAAKC